MIYRDVMGGKVTSIAHAKSPSPANSERRAGLRRARNRNLATQGLTPAQSLKN
jgi:hypothetical protein